MLKRKRNLININLCSRSTFIKFLVLHTPAFPLTKQSGTPSPLMSWEQIKPKTTCVIHLFHSTSPLRPLTATTPPSQGAETPMNIGQKTSGCRLLSRTVPKPKTTSSIPSLFTSTVLIGDSDVNRGKDAVQTSETFKSLQGTGTSLGNFSLVLATIQFRILSIGNGNNDTKMTTMTINPENYADVFYKFQCVN